MERTQIIREQIERRFGYFPAFFEPALSTPEVLETLWDQTLAYLDNPVPEPLKTQIAVRLARYSSASYCLVRSICIFKRSGVSGAEILRLLERPAEIFQPLNFLRHHKETGWPGSGTVLEEAMVYAAECIYLRCPEADSFQDEMRRILGQEAYSHWVALLTFVEIAHRWAEAHPAINLESDPRTRARFEMLIREEPRLGDFVSKFQKQVAREQNEFKREEARKEARRMLEHGAPARPDLHLKRTFQAWARGLAVAVGILGAVFLLSCLFQYPIFQGWTSRKVEVAANSGFAFTIGGISLWLWVARPRRRTGTLIAKTLGGIIAVIGALTLWEYFSGNRLGMEHILSMRPENPSADFVKRMSSYTALVLLFLGSALLFLDRIYHRRFRPAEHLALWAGTIGLITLLGYAYEVPTALVAPRSSQMSLSTAVLTVLLAAGILIARPVGGFFSIVTSTTTAGKLVRRLILLLGLAPALLGWTGLAGQWKGWYGTEFGAALVVASNMLLFGMVILSLGWSLYQAEIRRRVAQRLLLTREFDFRATFDHAAVGMAHLALNGRWIRVNEKLCQITGYTREELLERTFRDITAPEDFDCSVDFVDRLVRGEISHYAMEKRYVRKNGEIIWGNLTVTMLKDPGGQSKYAIAIVEDISERKKAEEEIARQKANAESASRSKDRLLSMISHELRTPLTPVLAAITMSEAETAGVERQATMEMMRRNIEHEVCLIDDLLDFTRISNGKLRLNLAPVDLHALMSEVFKGLKPTLETKGISARMQLHSARSIVLGDAARLRQILLNLLDNAKKFTPAGGYITLTSSLKEGEVFVGVADTGAGISEENRQRIFEAFEQGEQSIQRRYGGLGLGLTITKGLVEAHGGKLEVESPGPGRGSTFTFSLAVIDQAVAPPKPQRDVTAVNAAVLLVEDHDDTRITLQRILKRRGHKVVTATSVADAVAACGREQFDMVISDIGLPDGSGLDLLKTVAASCGSNVPGIALSGFASEEDINLSVRAGFVRHLTKPVNMEELEEAILHVMVRQGRANSGV